jgi:hypothetical protein
MDNEQSNIKRNVKQVNLFPCDDGLSMVFIPDAGESVTVTMDWVNVAQMNLRIDAFGKEALTMMQAGLDPYSSAQRQSFLLAELQIASEGGPIGFQKD